MASDQLIWEITKSYNSHLRKSAGTRRSGRIVLAAEPGNLTNTHSYSHSGIARTKAVDMSLGENGVVMHLNSTKRPHKPVTGSDIHLNKGFKKSIKTIDRTAASHYYRPDMRKAAVARYTALYHDQRVQKSVGKRAAAAAIKKGRTSKRTA